MQNDFLRLEKDGSIAVIWLDQAGASVNTISPKALDAVGEALELVEQDDQIEAVIFISGKRDAFIAGADLNMLKTLHTREDVRALGDQGHALIKRVRSLNKPTIAAIHGAAMGGGLEVALACTYRIATSHKKTKLALPEVMLGLLPGGGGTQFLPRLIGLQQALDMMLTGKTIYPRKARRIGLVDALTYHHGLLNAAKQAATQLIAGKIKPDRNNQNLGEKLLESNTVSRRIIYQQAEARVRKETHGNYPAPFKIIECVKAGLESGLEAGFEAERTYFAELVFTPESRALVSLFFAKQGAEKNPFPDKVRPVSTLGILGSGLMGAGIADVSANNGLNVLVKDQDLERAALGRKHVWKNATKQVKKRILSPFDRDVVVERVVPIADYTALGGVDLVVEAVPENLDLKRAILEDTEAIVDNDTIFASNTSSIPISNLAAASKRPETVIGMHYFSPVEKMPLLEIIKTEQTADWVIATAFKVGRRQGKTMIVVNDGPGFYTTRILAVYMNEALLLMEEGVDLEQVDKVMTRFGFPIGPYALFDLVGIDVASKITEEMAPLVQERELKISTAAQTLKDAGFLGQKSGKGFYRYESDKGSIKKKGVNESIYDLFGTSSRKRLEAQTIQDRLALLLVNEATYCLHEGILQSAVDGDVGAVFGLGFPPFLGGPFRFIDTETASAVTARLSRLQLKHGNRFAPSPILREYAQSGATFFAA